jgi:salicylate hydroxylase
MHALLAGGGIGGMSAALALLRAGIDVDVYEAATALTEVGAGIQLSPNGCRVLDELGVFEELAGMSCDPVRKEFRLWNSGKAWRMFDLGSHVIEQYGYPYLTVYRPDLLGVLERAVREIKPDAIHLDSRCAGFTQDDDGVTLNLVNGNTARGDVLIGADGWRSVIRTALWGECTPQFSGMVAWRGTIPMERLPEHLTERVGSTWIGPGAHVVTYPLHGGAIMNFVATVEGKEWTESAGSVPGDREECRADFADWHEDIHTYIDAVPSLIKWALVSRDPIPHWTQGRVSLLGDACHATLPFLAQGAVHAMEDGIVLARCLVVDADDPAKGLHRYEDARIERTSKMVRGATANTGRFHSPELATPESAESYLGREWSSEPIADRYHWLYVYDAVTAPI